MGGWGLYIKPAKRKKNLPNGRGEGDGRGKNHPGVEEGIFRKSKKGKESTPPAEG